jgi:drug/metabolite transporter (DMT)-like permease
MTKQSKAYLCAIATVLCWSTVASAFKIALRYVDTLQLLLYASVVATFVFLVHLVICGKMSLVRSFSRNEWLRSAAMGFLNPFLYYIVLFKAYSLLPAQQAQPINFVWPITLVLLSIPLLGQKITAKDFAAVLISFAGVVVISTKGDIWGLKFESITGVILALGSTVIWSLSWILNVRDRQDETVRLFANFIFGSLYILALAGVSGRVAVPDLRGLCGAAYAGAFEMGIPFLLWLKALKLSKTTARVSSLIYLTPFLSLVFIHIVVGEHIHPATIGGLVFIVAGIAFRKL